jgi:hypothetical protein
MLHFRCRGVTAVTLCIFRKFMILRGLDNYNSPEASYNDFAIEISCLQIKNQ